MMRLITFWLFYISVLCASAQNGSYFLSHHAPSEENSDNVCFDMEQDDNGVMFFAVKAGVLEFDGRAWDPIPGTGAVYAIAKGDAGEIFWAGAKGFGKIGTNKNGNKELQLISDAGVSNVFQIIAVGQHVYFLSENNVFVFHDGRAKGIRSPNPRNTFTGMFDLFGVLYVQTDRNDILRVGDQGLTQTNLNPPGHLVFHTRLDDEYIVGTDDNRIFRCGRELRFRPVQIEDQPYADANAIVGGAWVKPDLLALATLRGGVMMVNPENGKRDQVIDYMTGLPDNEVFSLMADANQNIWVAHQYGFTQISPGLPFRSYSYYPGLAGNLLCVYSHRGGIYVGTSLGLFKLHKEEEYDEIVTYVKAEQPSIVEDHAVPAAPPEGVPTAQKRRGLFGLFRKNRAKAEAHQQDTMAESIPKVTTPDAPRLQKKVTRVLRSTQYVYRKVEGIGAKVSHLTAVEGTLIAAGLEGVFEVQDLRATSVLTVPARFILASPRIGGLIVSTYSDEIWKLVREGDTWRQQNIVHNLGDQVDYIFEGPADEWWLCGLGNLYRLQMDGESIRRFQTVQLSNADFARTVGFLRETQVWFVNRDGFFRYSRAMNSLIKIDSIDKPYQYFPLNGQILYRDQHRWSLSGTDAGRSDLQLLNLFQNLRFVTTDEEPGSLWMIRGGNELVRFRGGSVPMAQNGYPVFVKSVQNNTLRIADLSRIEIDQSNSAVTFEVVKPYFLNARSIEFRFFLDGMHDQWSEWSSANNKISFPYLPPGQYNLRVQARDIFGAISELDPLSFEVIPPYWKRSWFYALEFLVFASLVVLSFRLSTRYRIVSRILSLITIILLIEFIQTVIGSSISNDDSPVVEFLIQFVVAILILPVEGYLRNLMLRSLDSSGKFHNFISPRSVAASRGARKPRRPRKLKETL